MDDFIQTNRGGLEALKRISAQLGARADYVQGGGGNTSVKLPGGKMAIKASGYCLKDIDLDRAYAVLDADALRSFYLNSDPEQIEDVERAGAQRAKDAILPVEGMPALRPSVEAGFHSLLKTCVAHTHSVYANLATCAADGREVARQALAGADYAWAFVPYTDPGARLTFSIRDEMARVERSDGRRPAVILLENHGVIVHADTPEECLRLHADANQRLAAAFGVRDGDFPGAQLDLVGDGVCEVRCPMLSEALRSGRYDEKFLLQSPLYPDQMVFLTGSFRFGDAPEADMCVADPQTGVVRIQMPQAKAQVIADTLACVIYICETLRASGHALSTMDDAARTFIANWESEKYRKSLAGR